jgi:regulator of protease activity HflC (stomatin/prohibitin superfamily)
MVEEVYVRKRRKFGRKSIAGIIVGIILVIGLLSSVRVIPPGHVGVQVLFGKVSPYSLKEGLHIIFPLIYVENMSIRTAEVYEHADVPSKEGLTVTLEASILYRLLPEYAPLVYRNIGKNYKDIIVLPAFRSVMRGATVKYEAKALYTAERKLIEEQIYKDLAELLRDRGILLENVLLRRIGLPQMVTDAIDAKLAAEQDAERMKFVLSKEQKEAERKRIEAQGIADFQKLVAEGISPQLLKWKAIEAASKFAESPNTKIVILGDKSGLPIILSEK